MSLMKTLDAHWIPLLMVQYNLSDHIFPFCTCILYQFDRCLPCPFLLWLLSSMFYLTTMSILFCDYPVHFLCDYNVHFLCDYNVHFLCDYNVHFILWLQCPFLLWLQCPFLLWLLCPFILWLQCPFLLWLQCPFYSVTTMSIYSVTTMSISYVTSLSITYVTHMSIIVHVICDYYVCYILECYCDCFVFIFMTRLHNSSMFYVV